MGSAAAIIFKLGIVFLFLGTIIVLSLRANSDGVPLRRLLPGGWRPGRWRNLRLPRHKI
ncbi:MAG TPA: hypothetical protein VNQ56_09950 [Pseudolabrys sp.]|nr:hypothetical protein [Pseudolabrys sp.]